MKKKNKMKLLFFGSYILMDLLDVVCFQATATDLGLTVLFKTYEAVEASLGGGASYRILALAGSEIMTPELLETLSALVK